MSFYAGSTHTAHIRLINPTAWPWIYQVVLSIGGVAMPAKSVSLAAGAEGKVDIAVQMPSTPGSLNLQASVTETTTNTFLGTEPLGSIDVVAQPVPEVTITLGWD